MYVCTAGPVFLSVLPHESITRPKHKKWKVENTRPTQFYVHSELLSYLQPIPIAITSHVLICQPCWKSFIFTSTPRRIFVQMLHAPIATRWCRTNGAPFFILCSLWMGDKADNEILIVLNEAELCLLHHYAGHGTDCCFNFSRPTWSFEVEIW